MPLVKASCKFLKVFAKVKENDLWNKMWRKIFAKVKEKDCGIRCGGNFSLNTDDIRGPCAIVGNSLM